MWKRLSDLTKRYWSFFICVLLCSAAAECIGPIQDFLWETDHYLSAASVRHDFHADSLPGKAGSAAWERLSGPAANRMLSMGVVFAMAKLGISGGASIEQMISASPILILQNIGNIGTVLVALPVALLLGMGREAVGMTHALSREPNVALIADKYGSESRGIPGSDGLLYCRDCFWQHFYEYCSACVYCPGAFQPGGGGYGGGMRQLLYDGLRAGGSD